MSSEEISSRSPTAVPPPETDRAEQERVSSAFQRLRNNPDFHAFKQILDKRRVAEGEKRVNELLRANDARLNPTQAPPAVDLASWASEVRYWRGYADGLFFAMMLVDRVVLSNEKPEPKPKEERHV